MAVQLRIVSGGQTGADRGALEAALDVGAPHGGYCPHGRRAEDGEVPAKFDLVETHTKDYRTRTYLNVHESDATLIVCQALTGGSKLTRDYAHKLGKPVYVVPLGALLANPDRWAQTVLEWVLLHQPKTLNVAGSRESKAPGIQAAVRHLITSVLVEYDLF